MPSSSVRPALIIFDCDGVLVDSEPISNRVVAENLTRHGFPLTTEQAMGLFIGGTMKSVERTARDRGADLPVNWLSEIYGETIAALTGTTAAIPGVKSFLDQLKTQNIAFCVASNGPQAKMAATLTSAGLAEYFQNNRFSAHDIGVAKPEPDLFLHAATTMGHAPQSCWVIEDSFLGARAAHRASMRCFGLARDTPADKLAAEGAEVFCDYSELIGLI